jgi:hypothetical protein
MKIAVLSDHRRFYEFIRINKLPIDDFKCISKLSDCRGYKFDYMTHLYTHLDLYELKEELLKYNIPFIESNSLLKFYKNEN